MINVTKTSMPPMEEYIKEIAELWDSCWISNMGMKHSELEKKLEEHLNAPRVSLFANGHFALEAALRAFELEGEVITTPFTFASTTHAIVRSGLKPVFCDIREDNYTIDADKIEALITPDTTAIVPVHVYGNICEVEKIEALARKYNLKVIYDAAHAFGEKLNGRGVAGFGDASMFSFHATKVFNTVEGGAVAYSDSSLDGRMKCLKDFGISFGGKDILECAGNGKMSEFHAAMGLCNLRHIDEYITARQSVAKRYIDNLSAVKGIKIWQEQEGVEHNYSYFPVLFEGSRDEVCERLLKEGICARKYFYPLTNDLKCYDFDSAKTPIAKHISDHILCLPLYPDLSFDDVDRICRIISE